MNLPCINTPMLLKLEIRHNEIKLELARIQKEITELEQSKERDYDQQQTLSIHDIENKLRLHEQLQSYHEQNYTKSILNYENQLNIVRTLNNPTIMDRLINEYNIVKRYMYDIQQQNIVILIDLNKQKDDIKLSPRIKQREELICYKTKQHTELNQELSSLNMFYLNHRQTDNINKSPEETLYIVSSQRELMEYNIVNYKYIFEHFKTDTTVVNTELKNSIYNNKDDIELCLQYVNWCIDNIKNTKYKDIALFERCRLNRLLTEVTSIHL